MSQTKGIDVEAMERKWERESTASDSKGSRTERVSQTQPQDEPNTFCDNSGVLEPIEAHRKGDRCSLCHLLIVTGDQIVTADGVEYAHRDCAETAGWSVS